MPPRRLVHSRSIKVDAYVREDGLWDLEAVLVDTKSRDFPLPGGARPAGEPVHEMILTVTIDARMVVVAAAAQSLRVPYTGYCESIAPAYEKLVGLNLARNFRQDARERLGGPDGCTHLTELCAVLPTAAVQAFAGEVLPTREGEPQPAEHPVSGKRPFQLDRCHALRTDGPAVARFYPRWFRDPAVVVEPDEPASH